MPYNLNLFEIKKIDILTISVSIILFFKFFIFNNHIPLHDEVTAIERFTEWKNFLRKDGVNNHTLISFYGTLIRSFFGFELSAFRLISFFSFVGILFVFNRTFNNIVYSFLFLVLIYNSNFLYNSINTFRGYYIYSFISCLIFYQIILFNDKNIIKINLSLIFIMLFLIVINALYGLYICVPVLLSLSIYMYKKKFFYIKGLIFFVFPVTSFLIIFSFIDGLVINNNENLNLNFIINNINSIFLDNLKTGIFNIFNATPELVKNNEYKSIIFTFDRFLNGEDKIYSSEYISLLIYFLTILILFFRIFKNPSIVDYTILFIFLFFFIIDKDPFIRVHSGKIYFCIFYIFYNLKNIFELDKYFGNKKRVNIFFLILIIIFTLSKNPDPKWQETKTSVIKIKNTLKVYSCIESNNILTQYEIWIVKNIFPDLCNSRYDFEKKINILF